MRYIEIETKKEYKDIKAKFKRLGYNIKDLYYTKNKTNVIGFSKSKESLGNYNSMILDYRDSISAKYFLKEKEFINVELMSR